MSAASHSPRRLSSGGSANELGSLHRAGIAAVLAAHGLLGAPLLGRPGCVPTQIALETTAAVDDIRCEMENGTTWFIQAKRSSSTAALDATVDQWVRQETRSGDRLLLITRTARGLLGTLAEVLPKVQRDSSVPLNQKDAAALDRLVATIGARTADQVAPLLQSIDILGWATEDEGDATAALAIARLEHLMTRPADGATAFRVLRDFFHRAGGTRTASDQRGWLVALENASLDLRAPHPGSPAARIKHLADVELEYRAAAAAQLNRLDLSALSRTVPEITVDGLADSLTVRCFASDEETERHQLVDVLRRNPRFLLRGLPGMGKSASMQQMAAWLAADPQAPLPISVSLREVATSILRPSDVTLSRLLRAASTRATRTAATDVEQLFHAACRTGHVVLLLDGFDETFQKSTAIAVGLRNVLDALHPDCGAVVATRDSALESAAHLGLPAVELTASSRPGHSSLVAIIDTVADQLGLAREERDQWRTARQYELNTQVSSREAIWSVPLLATLATLQICHNTHLTADPFHLLDEVVSRSISTWSSRYDEAEHRDLDPQMRREMLMPAFAVIGRLLTRGDPITPEVAASAVAAVLGPWKLPPANKKAVAESLVNFWDERVGVFVVVNGVLQPRSQQFAELADARAALTLDSPAARTSWLETALERGDKRNAASLATTASPELARRLMHLATEPGRPDRRLKAAQWTRVMAPHWHHLAHKDLLMLCDVLRDAAAQGLTARDSTSSRRNSLDEKLHNHEERGGPGWLYVLALAATPLPPSAREARRSAIDSLHKFHGRSWLIATLTDLANAQYDGRPLAEAELARLDAVLQRVPPEDSSATATATATASRRASTSPYEVQAREPTPLPGMNLVAEGGAQHAPQLSDSQAQALFRLAWRTPSATYERISQRLRAAGFKDRNEHHFRLPKLSRDLVSAFEDLAGFGWIRRHVVEMDLPRSRLTPVRLWRLTALADLVEALDWNKMTVLDLRQIQPLPHNIAVSVITAGIHLGGVDVSELAEQTYVLTARADAERDGQMLYAPRLIPLEYRPVPQEVTSKLAQTVLSPSDWLSAFSRDVIGHQGIEPVAHAACHEALQLPGQFLARRNLGFALLSTSDHLDVDVQLLAEGESGDRCAAAVELLLNPAAADGALLIVLRHDPDATVRHEAGADRAWLADASFWTCLACSTENSMELAECSNCSARSTFAAGALLR